MKAIVIDGAGGPEVLRVRERPIPQPADNEVLIHVEAAGVNRPDVAQRKGLYPPPPCAPQDIPGLEVAGTIVRCGAAVTGWKVGDAVCALLSGGGYAAYAVANATHCLPIPTNLDFIEASSLPETIFTVWHNVFQRGQLKRGEHFLVHGGSSGIGITAIQMAKAFGATVSATAGSDKKCTACLSLGADRCINYKTADFETVLQEHGVDVILDMVGGDYIPKNIRLLRADGRLVFINTMKGGAAEIDFSIVMKQRLIITGSTLRNRFPSFKTELTRKVRRYVWPLIYNGEFKPLIFARFPMEEADKAHQLMESTDHIGKIVLVNNW